MKEKIIYRKAIYRSTYDKNEIERLYREIFNVDISPEYDLWFSDSQYGKTIGVIAIDGETEKVIGHFAAVPILANINGESVCFRMSMGFMTDINYRGKGIAIKLYENLKREILLDGKTAFVIGFPNDVSVNMHLSKMEYVLFRDFQFVVIPRRKFTKTYRRIIIDDVCSGKPEKCTVNKIIHDKKYLKWRFSDSKYDIYLSENGKIFICTKFNKKIDLVYWDESVSEKELLDFAGYMYESEHIVSVETWNSMEFLNNYPKRERKYHMCINYLNLDKERKKYINQNWKFYMGDCEVF